jgi:hypothetical protein
MGVVPKIGEQMNNARAEVIAADYWNQYLEHNRLRTGIDGKGADTNAGAFLAWMLEGAGDILREASKQWPDRGYQYEKVNRLKNYINSRDWRDRLSDRELQDLYAIQKQIDALPANSDLVIKIKALMTAITVRTPSNVLFALDQLKPLLDKQESFNNTIVPPGTIANRLKTYHKPPGTIGHWEVVGNKWVHFPD